MAANIALRAPWKTAQAQRDEGFWFRTCNAGGPLDLRQEAPVILRDVAYGKTAGETPSPPKRYS